MLVGKRDKVDFAQTVDEFNRKFKAEKRDLVLTSKALFLLGREKVKEGANKGKLEACIKRKFDFDQIAKVKSFVPFRPYNQQNYIC